MNSFGRILEKHLKSSGHKKKDLAAQLEVTEAYISIICHGTQPPPTYKRCEKIADFLKLERKERLEFFKAAIESRAKKDIQVFLDEISLLSTDPKDKESTSFYDRGVRIIGDQMDKKIPLIKAPKSRPELPISRASVIEYVTISCILNESFYAVHYQGPYEAEIGLNKRDLLVIDPANENIKSGDLVLVRVKDEILVKRMYTFEVSGVEHVELSPADDNNKLIFERTSKDFEVFGRVAHAVISFQ